MKDAFWQIPLDIESREKTAFTVPGRPLYHFKGDRYIISGQNQTLCRLMHKVIPYRLHDRVFVYLDDLLTTSVTFGEHLELLKEVAARLRSVNLTINVEKSKFCLTEMKYLGYIVGQNGLKVNPEKVKAITECPIPKTTKHVRRFLGFQLVQALH